jgi:pimeloyl-ACP methyl ester carboxylesterase
MENKRKAFRHGLLCALTSLVVFSWAAAEKGPSPPGGARVDARAGDLILKAGTYGVEKRSVGADIGTIMLPENRASASPRLIRLPVVRIPARGDHPAQPVFLLAGGPGQSNLWKSPPEWLLQNHDVVMIGYRGVDGSVSLDSPEVGEALKVKEYPLSGANLEKLGRAYRTAFERLKKEGVDVDSYTMVDVVDDIEDARKALGYGKIDLFSESYGTRVAYIYGLRYPESVRRTLMVGVNPPGHFVWEPGMVEAQLRHYADLWKKDPWAVARSADLIGTIRNVLGSLPRKWLVFRIDPDKVRAGTFMFLYYTSTAAQVFDAYVAAEKGDWSGLAFISVMFDRMIPKAMNWGDNAAKALSADYDPARDYEADMAPPGAILGSPLSKLMAVQKYGAWPIKPIPEEYRKLRYSDVETLMVNGNIDFSTPAEYAKNELLPYLRNGRLVVLAEMGHCNDVTDRQPEAFRRLAEAFYLEGTADDSMFHYESVDFKPSQSLPDMAKRFVKRVVLIGGGAFIFLIVIAILLIRLLRKRKKERAVLEGE